MSITTYSELQTAIANWIHRDDLTARIPEFIALAEADMNATLRTRQQLQRSYATASSEFLELPDDWLALRNIDLTNGGIRYPLTYLTPEQMDQVHDGATGQPRNFTILGGEFQLWPAPDGEYRLDISYHQEIPALSDSNTSNWVLANFPHAYLHGALVHGWQYSRNEKETVAHHALFKAALAVIKKRDSRDRYSGSSLSIRVA